ncbi:MAG: hypothetical protein AVDCRST_MAG78-1390 [uncultured Rubrobacteraceae bacterium]|uniref:Uncharacterized protein n=1 Tax=uncultured Rubrobacteraceae bacterium TaxID=349277 RepID=A0A6J4Q040_9ACTN|nr:MAG: hypothetical protein AVDCRST_MAG78-1390 [uncultured Rubrobacteraceae bacterium]
MPSTLETSEEDYELVMNVCMRGTFLGMKYSIPARKDPGGGSDTNMSSIATLFGLKTGPT